MVKSLESFIAETQKSYEPAKQALQQQIDAIDPQLAKAQASINANYNNQQATLNRNRDLAAESASMQAAGSGGSFGGAANLANRKYYQQSFVPAQQSLNTNRASSLDQAQQQADANRLSLQSQLANLTSEANRYATQRYDAAVEAERQRAAQRAAAAAQNAYNRYLAEAQQQMNRQQKQSVDFSTWINSTEALPYAKGNNLEAQKNYLKYWNAAYTGGPYGKANSVTYVGDFRNSDIYKAYKNWQNS